MTFAEAILEEQTKFHNISYAGLKDKYATTTQYISMPASYEKFFAKFKHPQIEILGSFLSREKLNIGDLKGNRFKIRLRNVTPAAAEKLDKPCEVDSCKAKYGSKVCKSCIEYKG